MQVREPKDIGQLLCRLSEDGSKATPTDDTDDPCWDRHGLSSARCPAQLAKNRGFERVDRTGGHFGAEEEQSPATQSVSNREEQIDQHRYSQQPDPTVEQKFSPVDVVYLYVLAPFVDV